MFEHALCGAADENSFQTAARDRAHDHDIDTHVVRKRRQYIGCGAELHGHLFVGDTIGRDEFLNARKFALAIVFHHLRCQRGRHRRHATGRLRNQDRRHIGVNDMQVALETTLQQGRPVEDAPIERDRFVIHMPRIDCGKQLRRRRPRLRLDEQQWHGTAADQMPIRIGDERALGDRMMMRVLHDQISARRLSALKQFLVQRIAAFCCHVDFEPALSQLGGQRIDEGADVNDELGAAAAFKMLRVTQRARFLGIARVQLDACP